MPVFERLQAELSLHWREWSGAGRQAGVLVALSDEPEPTVLLGRRADHLRLHPGEIAFPGGKREPGDRSSWDTGLRESLEEVGLEPSLVEPLGEWDVSLYVFTSPYNPQQTCLDGKDIAGPGIAESVRIDNDHLSGQPRQYMIGVDSWRADVSGDFTLTLTCDFAVSTDQPSFSVLKSRFHGGDR